jgi:uncharacterized protein (DUF697 family)
LVISGVIFALVALAHLGRLVYHWSVQVGDWTIPMWPSWSGMIVAAILSLWAFSLLCHKCKCGEHDAEKCH